jgi:hypothetical protein
MKTKLGFNPLTGNFDLVTSELDADEVVNVPSGNLVATDVQGALNELQSDIDTRELVANKGVANGYASLDAGGKVPATQLPSSVMEYLGTWDAATNTPTLADGTGSAGNVYLVTVAGTQNLGSGSLTFQVGDWVVHNGTIWQQSPSGDEVLSVFGRTGVVVSASGDYTASQITNVPSGNLAAVEVQAALNELQSDIDTRATSSDLTAHTGASSGVHGVTGSVVGTTDTQNLTNKTFTTPIFLNNTGVSGAVNQANLAADSTGRLRYRQGTNQYATFDASALTVDGRTYTLPDTDLTFAGRANSETLTNKLISSTAAVTGALILPVGTQAERPTATEGMIRFNTDVDEFEGYANSAWQPIGGGINEQPLKNYLKTYATAAVAPGTLSTVSATGNIATTAGLFYADTTSGSSALTQSSSTALRGSFNYLSALSGADTAGGRFFQFPAVALESTDLGKSVSISFDVTGNTTDNDWDVVVVRYNSSGTFQELIPVAGNASTMTSTPSAKLPTGTAQFRGFFVAGATSGDLYALRFRRRAGSVQVRLDTLYVGPQVQLAGAPLTDWQSYTPVVNNLGTGGLTTAGGRWARHGDTMLLNIALVKDGSNGSGANPIRIDLPPGYSIDTTKIPNNAFRATQYGSSIIFDSSASAFYTAGVFSAGNGTYLEVVRDGAVALTGGLFEAGDYIELNAVIPIAGWSSNVTMAERAVESFSFNTSGITSAGAVDTTSFGYGPAGAAIGSIVSTGSNSDTRMRVRFQESIQPTDRITIELNDPTQPSVWTDSALVTPRMEQGTSRYGITWSPVTGSTTDIDVRFGNKGSSPSNATYAGDGTAWSALTNYRWRARKTSSGAAVGYPVGARNVVGDTTGTAVPVGMLGEQIRSAQTSSTNFPASSVLGDLTSITLTPGVWDVSLSIWTTLNAAICTSVFGGIGTVAGNSSTGLAGGDTAFEGPPPTANYNSTFAIPQWRVLVTANTTYYLKYAAIYSSGTPQARGRLSAVRVG